MISRNKFNLVLFFLIFLVSCDLFVTDVESSYSQVIIELPSSRSLIDEISLYEVLITGKDIDDLKFIKSEGGTFNLNIPSGDGVTFVINIYNLDSSLLLYSGSVTVNLKPNEKKQLNIDVYQSVRQLVYDGNENTSGTVPTATYYNANSTASILGNTGLLVKTGYTFSGWNTLADGSGTSYNAGSTLTLSGSSVTLFAIWSVIPSYIVTYNLDGGSADQALVNFDSIQGAIVILNDGSGLTKSSYTFSGWSLVINGDLVSSSFTMPGNSVTLYAVWTLLPTYTVTYNLDGGSGTIPIDNNNYLEGSNITLNDGSGLTYSSYSFIGWALTSGGTVLTSPYVFPGNNINLYTIWTAVSVSGISITSLAPETLFPGGTYQMVAAITPADALNQSVSWSSSDDDIATVDGSGLVTAVTAGSVNITATSVDGSITGIQPVTVSTYLDYNYYEFIVNAGTGPEMNSILSITIKDGVFSWLYNEAGISQSMDMYMELEEGEAVVTYNKVLENNVVTIDTEFEDSELTIIGLDVFNFLFTSSDSGTFTSNDADNTDYSYSGVFNASILSSNTELLGFDIENSEVVLVDNYLTINYAGESSLSSLTPTIYTALGATISPSSGTTQDFTNPVDYIVTAQDGTEKTYTVEVNKVFNVTYNLEGGSAPDSYDNNNYNEGGSVTLIVSTDVLKSGYTFSGWALTSGGTILGSTFSMPANHQTVYAVWTPIDYFVTYDSGGFGGPGVVTYHTGDTVPVDVSVPTHEVLVFSHWSLVEDGVAASDFIMGTADVTLYVNWIPQ